jgi:hypothetical protein
MASDSHPSTSQALFASARIGERGGEEHRSTIPPPQFCQELSDGALAAVRADGIGDRFPSAALRVSLKQNNLLLLKCRKGVQSFGMNLL